MCAFKKCSYSIYKLTNYMNTFHRFIIKHIAKTMYDNSVFHSLGTLLTNYLISGTV